VELKKKYQNNTIFSGYHINTYKSPAKLKAAAAAAAAAVAASKSTPKQ
jgi:hypothetical protein